MTDRFDPHDSEHRAIKQDLKHGIALKEIATTGEVDRALATAGFEVVEGIDRAVDRSRPSKPWYQPMAARIRMQNLKAHIGHGWSGRGTAGAAEGNQGCRQGAGSDRRRIRRRRQDRDLHAAVLLPRPQAPLGRTEPKERHELPPTLIKLTTAAEHV